MVEEIVTRIEIFSFLETDFFYILLKSDDNFKVIVEKKIPHQLWTILINKVKTHSQMVIMETRNSTQYFEYLTLLNFWFCYFCF